MEIRIGTKQILLLLNILSWITFIAVCVEAGGIMFNAAYVLYKPDVAKYFWNGADLSALIAHDRGQFMTLAIMMTIVAVLKTIIFYLIIKTFYDGKFNMQRPFNTDLTKLVFSIAWLCFGAGLFSSWGVKYTAWIERQGIPMPDIHVLRIGGADVWLFMAVVLLVIGQVFKKGIELQTEGDLTV